MQLFAHRGASDYVSENSYAAFALALEQQADGIELDVRVCAGQAIVMHDATLDRTTNAQGEVSQLSMSAWQALDAGDGKPPPSLADVLTMVAGQCPVNIELKCPSVVACVAQEITSVIDRGLFVAEQLCVSSFLHHSLITLRQQLPTHPIAPLLSAQLLDYAGCAEPLAAHAIHSHVETTDQALVDDAHARGLAVRVYTVTQAQELLYMRDLGVEAVFVNDIPWARKVLAKNA